MASVVGEHVRENVNLQASSIVENRALTTRDEKRAAANLLARSFRSSPIIKYVFQDQFRSMDETEFLGLLEWLYDKRLNLSELAGNTIYGRFQGGVLVSTLNVGSNESQCPSTLHILESGLWYWPLRIDLPSFKRFMELGGVITSTSREKQQEVLLHLMMVATDERYRGHGHAAELIRFALSRIDGHICLDTQCLENVKLYQSLGFQLTYEWTVLEGTPWAYRNYLMQTSSGKSEGASPRVI